MKKIVAISFCFMLVVLPSFCRADDKAVGLLSQLSANIAALDDYRVEFMVEAENRQTQGSYIVSGQKFRIITPEFEVISDGESRYEVNHEILEVIVDAMDTSEVNILINPVKAFEFAENSFAPSYVGETEVDGRFCDLVELKPLGEDSAITRVKLYLGRDSGLPVRLEYGIDGIDDDVSVSVSSFRNDPDIKSSDFSFDKSAYKDYEIVDFR